MFGPGRWEHLWLMISLSIEDIPSRRRLIGRGIGCASQVWEASEEEKSSVFEDVWRGAAEPR